MNMKATKNNIAISIILITILLLIFPMQAYATTEIPNASPQVYDYSDYENGIRIVAKVYDGDNLRVDAEWGNEIATTVVRDGQFYVNGEYIEEGIVENLTLNTFGINDSEFTVAPSNVDTSGVKWGSWTTKSNEFLVYKLAAGTICTMVVGYILSQGITLVTIAEGTIVSAVGTAVTLGYDYFKVVAKYRIGYNSTTKYNFAQQSYTFYGKYKGQAYVKIEGPVVTTQKRADN